MAEADKVDLPQVDLMNFRVEYVRPRSGRASDEVARGRPAGTESRRRIFQKVYGQKLQTHRRHNLSRVKTGQARLNKHNFVYLVINMS